MDSQEALSARLSVCLSGMDTPDWADNEQSWNPSTYADLARIELKFYKDELEKKADQKKPTADERFEMKNKMFDEQIAMKDKMKSILSAEQFEKWNEMKEKHQEKFQRRNHEGMPNHKKNN